MKLRLVITLVVLAAFAAGLGSGVLLGRVGRVKLAQGETTGTAYLTGYSYWDNTPPGSFAVAFPKAKGYATVHDKAGGSGTYNDPVTVAVGHSSSEEGDMPDFEPGTMFYIPDFKKYFVVEDICGDGLHPQEEPCHVGHQDYVWLDVWVGGQEGESPELASACENKITGLHVVISSPSSRYPVQTGAILRNKPCT